MIKQAAWTSIPIMLSLVSPVGAAGWVSSSYVDKMTDATISEASILSSDYVGVPTGLTPPKLVVWCGTDGASIAVQVPIQYSGRGILGQVRIGNSQAENIEFTASGGTFFPKKTVGLFDKDFERRLISSIKLPSTKKIIFLIFSYVTIQAQFDTSDNIAEMSKTISQCMK
ncbi:hypothetical protein [Pinisolibacter aquiterrae]|uniref:hypothetical protein n=1 Tax=Pinisolibacter aquiterrae TaxID=2815579 RepID=UPI001C3E4427|nr:hypothetical protein [Pinisolibacter aquiterrae]MBV5264482.1 hypothetical protein [Pinisolibacter aquiterrae]MCC8234369.1 hypothetical protein [Pinisolibacter aquiterrae]